MNKFTLLFGVLLCLVMVNARHYDYEGETLENEDETLKRPKEHNIQPRHRKRRWQLNYDYSPPSYHYTERRDYDRNNQEVLLQQISRLLEELTAYIRRPPPPPPPPQPIFIPYPMPFNFAQLPRVSCNPTKADNKTPAVDNRVSDKDMDPNQNWGLVVSNENDYDDGTDGSRPISFDPIVPKQLMKRPAPNVEHGSVQASRSTEAPRFSAESSVQSASPAAGMCNAAILSCCGMSDKTQQSQCFSNIGCSAAFEDGGACGAASIKKALESFRVAYSPLN